MTTTARVAEECPLAAGVRKGHCTWCGRELPKGRRSWCSELHEWSFMVNHAFGFGSLAIKLAVGHCQMCGLGLDHEPAVTVTEYRSHGLLPGHVRVTNRVGNLEADHIERANSSHGVFGCRHHWSNLRVLCHECHVAVTGEQRADDNRRARIAAERRHPMMGLGVYTNAELARGAKAIRAEQRGWERAHAFLQRFPHGCGQSGAVQQGLALD